MMEHLRGQVADVLEVEPATLDTRERTFFELGLNSIGATLLTERVSRELGISLSTTIFFEHPRLEPLARRLLSLLEAGKGDLPAADGASGSPAREEQALVERIAGLSEDQARELIGRTLAELRLEVER
jgi:3-oxoacyl-[acyl-carrier-protein] synthase II